MARALTLATVGLLSGVAVTIATDGLIQPDVVPTPPVEPTPVQTPAGGATYRPGRRIAGERFFFQESARDYAHSSALDITLELQGDYTFVRVPLRAYRVQSDLGIMVRRSSVNWQPLSYRAEGEAALGIKSGALSEKRTPMGHAGALYGAVLSRSTAHYVPAGVKYYVHKGALGLNWHASAGVAYERFREPARQPALKPAPSARVHEFDSAIRFRVDGAAIVHYTPESRILAHVGSMAATIDGAATVSLRPATMPSEYRHTGTLPASVDGAASYSIEADTIARRIEGVLTMHMTGAAGTAYARDVLPHGDTDTDEDEALLLLFAKAMLE